VSTRAAEAYRTTVPPTPGCPDCGASLACYPHALAHAVAALSHTSAAGKKGGDA
jgi:hypothetical protein